MIAEAHMLLSIAQFIYISKAESDDALLRLATEKDSLAASTATA